MSQPGDNDQRPQRPDSVYPLRPIDPKAGKYEPVVYAGYRPPVEEEPPPKERYQFTLRELMALVTSVAVVLGILGLVPNGYAAENLAGVLGYVVLLSMIALIWWKPSRGILYVAWSALLVIYLIVGIAARVTSAP